MAGLGKYTGVLGMEVIQGGTAEMLRVYEQAKAGGAGKGKSGRLKPKGTKSTRAYTGSYHSEQ